MKIEFSDGMKLNVSELKEDMHLDSDIDVIRYAISTLVYLNKKIKVKHRILIQDESGDICELVLPMIKEREK